MSFDVVWEGYDCALNPLQSLRELPSRPSERRSQICRPTSDVDQGPMGGDDIPSP